MEQIENGMLMYNEPNREVVATCEYCGNEIYSDEEYYEFEELSFCLDCIHDWIDEMANLK